MASRLSTSRSKHSGFALILVSAIFATLAFGDANASEKMAFQHLQSVMDQYHRTFDVYTDLSAAGNHFVTLGRLTSPGAGDNVTIDPGFATGCFKGSTCIANTFRSSGNNWGGWYFMNGVLQGTQTQPQLNWGDYQNAGFDLTGATRLTFMAKGQSGGERVEFFALGIGRNPVTGAPEKPYPDSSPKVSLGYVTLTNRWREYVIRLQGVDLSYVLGGFGWVTSASQNGNRNISFYLDEIKYDKARLNEPRFLASYQTTSEATEFDTVMKNVAFGYDNALALLAFLSRGTADDMRRARLLADAFVYAIYNDRYFTDGRLRNAYQAGDLALFPGWAPNGKRGTVRMPGWWDEGADTWFEDRFAVSTHTGNVIWPMLALLNYYRRVGGSEYLKVATTLGEWVERETRDDRCAGGYTAGYEGWERTANNPKGQEKLLYKATEHNIDAYPAFMMLHEFTGEAKWKERAEHALRFVEAMWNTEEQHFWTGTGVDGCTLNKGTIPVDIQAWAIMALDDYYSSLSWAEKHCYTVADGFRGFDFNDDKDGVWFEGTAQMALAYQMAGEGVKSYTTAAEIIKAQSSGPNTNGKGIIAASHDGVSTGFDWEYFSRLHVGATAWYLFVETHYNPYWGMRTGPVPVVKANGEKDWLTVGPQERVMVTLSLETGPDAGRPADWWVLAIGPADERFFVYQGELFDLHDIELMNVSGLSPGTHYVYFAVDMEMDGLLTLDRMYLDSMMVHVTE